MPVGTWKVFQAAKKNIGKGLLDLSATTYRIGLVSSSSVIFSDPNSVSIWTSLTANEVPNGNGYTDSGKQLSAETFTGTASALSTTLRWDTSNVVWTATGGNITSIMGAVVFHSGGKLLCWCSLSSAAFTLSQGNTLTIQMNTEGLFKMY